MHHHASSCIIMHHHASSCIIMHHHASSCIIMHHHASSCIIMHHHASSCIIMHHHASSCIIMHHHASSCIMHKTETNHKQIMQDALLWTPTYFSSETSPWPGRVGGPRNLRHLEEESSSRKSRPRSLSGCQVESP